MRGKAGERGARCVLYDELIDFAREKQRGRRYKSIHKSVPNPIMVIVLGDSLGDSIDFLYKQLSRRWSSQLDAFQVCYCYIDKPYSGNTPVIQARLGVPEEGKSGAGTLCLMPEALSAVNDMACEAIKNSRGPGVTMSRADIHIILAPEDPLQAFATDVAAVAYGRFRGLGAMDIECRLYFMLPMDLETKAEKSNMRAAIRQLEAAAFEKYSEEVLIQKDAPPERCSIDRMVNYVMLLDEMNEHYQMYNAHGERLVLLADLIENGWNSSGFIQSAGVQDGVAGPEYWLAQAADTLCVKVMEDRSRNKARFKDICEEIMRLSGLRMEGVDKALEGCCLFNPGQVFRISDMDSSEAEALVFGRALEYAYNCWLKQLPELQITDSLKEMLDEAESRESLMQLSKKLSEWAENCDRGRTSALSAKCQGLPRSGNEAECARRFRTFMLQVKYQPRCKAEEQGCYVRLADMCAKYCREQGEIIRSEREAFASFAEEAREAWLRLKEKYNEGRVMPLKWIDERPRLSELRRLGAEAADGGDPRGFLSLVADCVDLGQNNEDGIAIPEPPVCCRLTVALGLPTWIDKIEDGAAKGHVIKTIVISDRYEDKDMKRVFVFNKVM